MIANTTAAETTDANGILSITDTGFTLGSNSAYNTNGVTYVVWCWKAGQGVISTNTLGSIQSTVSVNVDAGFSIVNYIGNGIAGATVGHGLPTAPNLIIQKDRIGSTYDSRVYHSSLSAGYNIALDTAAAQYQGSAGNAGYINSVNSSTFALLAGSGSGTLAVNVSGNNNIAYCWTEIPGFSKFGKYVGNGSADGPKVNTGFSTKWLIVKDITDAYNWIIVDSARNTYNLTGSRLIPNLSDAEANDNGFDLLSNGFKARSANGSTNAAGSSFIYAAFAENPFKYANAR